MTQVGDSIWIFDINKREYPPRVNGQCSGAPIWIKHWREHKIVDETTRSWVLDWGIKIPKKAKSDSWMAFSWEEVVQAAWINDNARHIADMIRHRDMTYDLLKKVAEVLDYKEKE